jgi:hypothetical protein
MCVCARVNLDVVTVNSQKNIAHENRRVRVARLALLHHVWVHKVVD